MGEPRKTFTVQIPWKLYDEAYAIRVKENRTLGNLIVHALDKYLEPHRPIKLLTAEEIAEMEPEDKTSSSNKKKPAAELGSKQVDELVAKVVERMVPEVRRLLEKGVKQKTSS